MSTPAGISYDPDPTVPCPWCGQLHQYWHQAFACLCDAKELMLKVRVAEGNFDPFDPLAGPANSTYVLWDAVSDYLNYPTRYQRELAKGSYQMAAHLFYVHTPELRSAAGVEDSPKEDSRRPTMNTPVKFVKDVLGQAQLVEGAPKFWGVSAVPKQAKGTMYVSAPLQQVFPGKDEISLFQAWVTKSLELAGLANFSVTSEVASLRKGKDFYILLTVHPAAAGLDVLAVAKPDPVVEFDLAEALTNGQFANEGGPADSTTELPEPEARPEPEPKKSRKHQTADVEA